MIYTTSPLALSNKPETEPSSRPLRFITATSLFDGHDAAINIIRRLLQSKGVEVIHLGHNRSVDDIVNAAIQEDADAIAVSSYQGGHLPFYRYLIEQLRAHRADTIKVFGGGGGVILAEEVEQLENAGVTRIYTPQDGQSQGLPGMIDDVIQRTGKHPAIDSVEARIETLTKDHRALAQTLTQIESGKLESKRQRQIERLAQSNNNRTAILGITGAGGAGKSSLTDELIRRWRNDYRDRLNIAVVAIDPTRQKTGGALLGDRLRMNAIDGDRVFMRSMATRDAANEIPQALPGVIATLTAAAYDLIIIETPGIGQGDNAIAPLVDVCLYVMTSEFGAATQLEKLNILDYADLVAINKFDRQGSDDARRAVQKQLQRNREQFDVPVSAMPVYGTIAAQHNDAGCNRLYRKLRSLLPTYGLAAKPHNKDKITPIATSARPLIPNHRQRYLAEIADCVRHYRQRVEEQSRYAHDLQAFNTTCARLPVAERSALTPLIDQLQKQLAPDCSQLLNDWVNIQQAYRNDTRRQQQTLSDLTMPKVALPDFRDDGDRLRWLMLENLPGYFPYTGGVFAFKRSDEEPTRMFAGEGDPLRSNRRFRYLAAHSAVNRLSTAFDSVTLYGRDPDIRPDIYGKIGNSGVSIATLDDMRTLYDGFDLTDPKTSVSMTINGPAPTLLAMYFNSAINQQVEWFYRSHKRQPDSEERKRIKDQTLPVLRGTLQADILKEDQGQNTCLFSTGFGLQLMADVQRYFIDHSIRHFYSVSVSGYHIAEAGANPITQLAFTLANGFTYLEVFLAQGMAIDDFADRLSFFFSNGMDPEYSVIGRVARRIWAIALRDRYQAEPHCRKLKYHIQTSGRSLHAQAMDFNEIRTTLQALIAVYDHCNSLHTNAKDEALTTPTEQSVARALAIQMIINKEWGLAINENPTQGAFIIDYLTDQVETAVLAEFDRLSVRGGVLGAMENAYQRSKIQEQSLRYETAKHDGSLPIVGVNQLQTLTENSSEQTTVARSTDAEKNRQIQRLKQFKQRHRAESGAALARLKKVALNEGNIFAELMNTVRVCSLGQITDALFEVGGQYRRNM